jgi:O-antigen ligase
VQGLLTRRRRTVVVGGAVAALVIAANASQGAYFSQSWGWVALAFLMPATVLLILDRAKVPGLPRSVFAGLVLGLAVWIASSALWSTGTSAPIREAERMLAYVGLALAVALVLRRGDGPSVLAGIFVGLAVVTSYALGTRLFPDVLETFDDPGLPYRLSEPVGYWNSLGLLASMALLVAFGVSAHARSTRLALAAAAFTPVFALTLYFTFSRGAWVAQVFGFAAMVALDPRRLRLLWVTAMVSVPALAVVAVASQQGALTTEGSAPVLAVTQGRRVALALAGGVLGSVVLVIAARWVASRMRVSIRGRRVVDGALVTACVAGMVAALVVAGGPVNGASALKARFYGFGPQTTDLNARLLSFSGSGRAEQIEVAIRAGRERPIVGLGAGSYEARWYLDRPFAYVIRDAHSLYAEMFGEVGLVGLVLLVGALGVPLVCAVPARRSRFVPAAAAAYLAWAAHSALDWNWELVGVTITGLLAGAVGMLSVERGPARPIPLGVKLPLAGLLVVLSLASVVSLVGNQALFAGRAALGSRDLEGALGHARTAQALLPWSHEPHVLYGDAAAGLGDRRGAVAAYRDALERAPDNFAVWLRVAKVSRGRTSVAAYRRVHELNPFETGLPDYVYR